MPFIAPEILEDIRARSDIVAVIESFFPLQRRGNTIKALCPFHNEKTPSFTVNQQRQIFHCFGCGKGGDVFRFVMEHEKLDFPGAVQMLARRAGINLEQTEGDTRRASERERLFEVNQAAARFFHDYLRRNAAAGTARRYLEERAVTEQAVSDFMIGYAPDKWDGLLNWARAGKYPPELLEKAGLVIPSTGRGGGASRYYDRFRRRLMFPIRDEQERVIGFSGRILDAQVPEAQAAVPRVPEAQVPATQAPAPHTAKYVNTPETALFHKGRILYGLDRARRAIAESGQAILCEGQIDVIQCHLAGFNNAVAVQGTAFTDDHARLLRRYADSIILLFDADSAGQNAALRAGEIFLEAGLAVRVATLPAGEDPDTILRRPDGKIVMNTALEQARSLIVFQIDGLRAQDDKLDRETGALRAGRAVLDMIRRAPSAVQQAHLLKEAAAALAMPEDVLQRELRQITDATRRYPKSEPTDTARAGTTEKLSQHELALAEHLAAEPELSDLVREYLPMECIRHPLCRRLVEFCIRATEENVQLAALLSRDARDDEEFTQFTAGILAAPPKITSEFATNRESVQDMILAMRSTAVQSRRKELQEQIMKKRAATKGKPTSEVRALEEEYAELGYDIARLKKWDDALHIM